MTGERGFEDNVFKIEGHPKYQGVSIELGGGDDGGDDGGMSLNFKDYVDARDDALHAHMDAQITGLRSDLSAISRQLSEIPGKLYVAGVAFTLFVGVVGVLAFGGDRFDAGISGASLMVQQSIEAQRTGIQNTKDINALTEAIGKRDAQIDAFIESMKGRTRDDTEGSQEKGN